MSHETDGAAVPASLLAALRAAVGPSQVLVDADLRATYETDWTRRFHGNAVAVVRPGSAEEVASVLRACAEGNPAVIPQGGNTGLVGGGVPRTTAPLTAQGAPRLQVVLSTRRMRSLGPVDEIAGEVTADAGVTLAALRDTARSGGWDFGVDMGSRDSATVGGMVATNAGGVNVLRHGSMRHQMVGFEAVLADGIGDPSPPGPAEGQHRLLRLRAPRRLGGDPGRHHPRTAAARTAVPASGGCAARRGRRGAGRRVRRAAAPDSLASLTAAELFDDDGMRLVLAHTGAEAPFRERHPRYLLVECAGAADPTDELVDAIASLPSRDAVAAGDEGGRHRLWTLREGHTESVNAEGVPHKLDVSVPIGRIGDFDVAVREAIRRWPRTRGSSSTGMWATATSTSTC